MQYNKRTIHTESSGTPPIVVVRTALLPTCRWSVGFESRCAAAVFSIQHVVFQRQWRWQA
jgi:hypothetical protein